MIRILLSLAGLPVLFPLLAWVCPFEDRGQTGTLPTAVAQESELGQLKARLDALQVRVTALNESLAESFSALEP